MAGKALNRRTVTLVISLVLAALAAIALASYVQGAHDNALKGQQAVTVYVAKGTIPSGTAAATAISQGLIVKQTVPKNYVPTTAITSLSQIQNQVAAADVASGEQIVTGLFKDPQQLHNGLLAIPTGLQAISVEVSVIPAVAAFIQPGDTVSVLALDPTAAPGGQPNQVKYLLQDVQVLAVGRHIPPAAAVVSGTATAVANPDPSKDDLTLAVSPNQAEQVAWATLQGQLYFTLVPPGQGPATTSGRNGQTLFN